MRKLRQSDGGTATARSFRLLSLPFWTVPAVNKGLRTMSDAGRVKGGRESMETTSTEKVVPRVEEPGRHPVYGGDSRPLELSPGL